MFSLKVSDQYSYCICNRNFVFPHHRNPNQLFIGFFDQKPNQFYRSENMKTKHQVPRPHLNKQEGQLSRNDEPASLILDEQGMISDCSSACERLFGYHRNDLVLSHISKLMPQLRGINFFIKGHINPRLGFLTHCGKLYQAHKKHGGTFNSALNFVHLQTSGKHIIRLLISPAENAEAC